LSLVDQKIYIEIPEIIHFLYPSYQLIQEPGILMRPINVVMKLPRNTRIPEMEDRLQRQFRHHILLLPTRSSLADREIVEREEFISLVTEVRKIRFNKGIAKKVEKLSPEEFIEFLKKSIVLKRWHKESLEVKEKVYNLFGAMMESQMAFFRLYFEITKTDNPKAVHAAVCTFLQRIKNYGEQKENLSDFYRKVVKKGQVQSFHLLSACRELVSLPPDIPEEIMFLNFYLSLKGADRR